MVDLHESMGLGNLITGASGNGPITQRRSMTRPAMPTFDSREDSRKPKQSEVLDQLRALQEDAYSSDPTGNLEIMRTSDG